MIRLELIATDGSKTYENVEKNSAKLDLSNRNLSSVVGLNKLTKLKKLILKDNKLTSLENLETLQTLTEISLDNNLLTAIPQLPASLLTFYARNNKLTSIESLLLCSNLSYLSLARNSISSIDGVERLTKLQTLNLGKNKFLSLPDLSSLKEMRELYLSDFQMKQCPVWLESMIQLTDLELQVCGLETLFSLEKFVNLERLFVNRNELTSVFGLEFLDKLCVIRLDSNLLPNEFSAMIGLTDRTVADWFSSTKKENIDAAKAVVKYAMTHNITTNAIRLKPKLLNEFVDVHQTTLRSTKSACESVGSVVSVDDDKIDEVVQAQKSRSELEKLFPEFEKFETSSIDREVSMVVALEQELHELNAQIAKGEFDLKINSEPKRRKVDSNSQSSTSNNNNNNMNVDKDEDIDDKLKDGNSNKRSRKVSNNDDNNNDDKSSDSKIVAKRNEVRLKLIEQFKQLETVTNITIVEAQKFSANCETILSTLKKDNANNNVEIKTIEEFRSALISIDEWCLNRSNPQRYRVSLLKQQTLEIGARLISVGNFWKSVSNNDFSGIDNAQSSLTVFHQDDLKIMNSLFAMDDDALIEELGDSPVNNAILIAKGAVQFRLNSYYQATRTVDRIRSWLQDWQLKSRLFGDKSPIDERYRQLKLEQSQLKKAVIKARHAFELEESEDPNSATTIQYKNALKMAQSNTRNVASTIEDETIELAVLAASHYPELIHRYADIGIDRILALDGAERVTRTLDDYEDVVKLSTIGNHQVLKAKFNGKECVVKKFNLSETKGKALFMNEAKALGSLKHPCVVEIQVVFMNQLMEHNTLIDFGFIQFPFYVGGDLSNWLISNERISDARKIVVLRSALQGLAYVHEKGIVHCDVKPANIFVTADGTGVLGDFDVSRDSVARTTMSTQATVASVVGRTFDYMAPELVSKAANFKSDVYSFALTMFDLFYLPVRDANTGSLIFKRPTLHDQLKNDVAIIVPQYANETINVALRELLNAMLTLNSEQRLSASQALSHRFFQLQLIIEVDRDPKTDKRECKIMHDEYWLDEGIECKQKHFISDEALKGYVMSLSNESVGKHNGKVKCPSLGCNDSFDTQLIARHVSADVFAAFMRMQKNAFELEMQRHFEIQMKEELEKANREKDIAAHRKHIIDNILTLCCPRCSQAFVDFTGCFALTCGRCSAEFCAWCLTDCGNNNAHRHVANCPNNEAPNRAVYGTVEQFEQCRQRRRTRLIREYLNALLANIDRAALIQACQLEFQNNNIQLQ